MMRTDQEDIVLISSSSSTGENRACPTRMPLCPDGAHSTGYLRKTHLATLAQRTSRASNQAEAICSLLPRYLGFQCSIACIAIHPESRKRKKRVGGERSVSDHSALAWDMLGCCESWTQRVDHDGFPELLPEGGLGKAYESVAILR